MPGEGYITIHEEPQRRPSIAGATRPPPYFTSPGFGGHQATRVITPQSAGGQQYHVQQPTGQYARPMTATVPPQQQQQEQQQHQYAAQTALYVVQPNTSVKICDINKEQPPTAEKAREKLSQYFVVRFTRANEDSGYASDGSRRKPSWKRAWRIEDRGISKREAARMVRELNRTKIPVMQKKGDLSEEERRQIEMALEDLQKQYDDDYFQTTLVQLDDRIEVKPKEQEKAGEREREKDRRKEKHRKVPTKQPSSRSKGIKKVITERVSLTAYFKRAPRPDVDPIAILRYHEAQREARIRQYNQAVARPQDIEYPAPPPPPPPPQPARQSTPHPPPRSLPPPQNIHAPRPGDGRGPGPSGHHTPAYHPQNRGPGLTIAQRDPQEHGHTTARPQPSQRRCFPRIHQRTRAPPSSTDESVYSEGFSDGEDDDTACTSPSTTSSSISQGSYDHPGAAPTPKPVFRESPVHYGIQPNFSRGGHPQPQGTVHIQPHRSHERRPGLHGQRPSISIPSHKPFVHQPESAPAPRPVFFPSRAANMATSRVPTAPSPPPAPIRVHPVAAPAAVGVGGPMPVPQAATATTSLPTHHIPPPPAHQHVPPPAPGQIPVAGGVTQATMVPAVSLDPKQLYNSAYAAGRADIREEAIRMAERIAAATADLEKEEQLYEERVRGSTPYHQRGKERLRRETERLLREERERELRIRERERDDLRRRKDSGVDMGVAPFAASNPFIPRPGLAGRTGAAAVETHTGYRAPRVEDDVDDPLCY
ncbi:hypothetical protein C8A03DRAFT_32312 [Achaetomium macrosporum]|uniref:Uncharacterized protein n=1 Tax=Achaetomium macrosporum TaxID=79813 RepID=A0AAN7CEI5_9PEZI|nr:hypothetical protein C8A03DRAFT_32312 [Achaetomium macrosporum]